MKAQDLHREAEELRENDKHEEALQKIELALVAYQKEKNYKGFCSALQSRVLIYKHLFYLSNDTVFAILARSDARTSLEIAKAKRLKELLGSSYFRIGEVDMLYEDYDSAVKNYQLALDNYFGTNAEKGDYTYHLGEAVYRSGDKKRGKALLFEGLKLIKENAPEVDAFLAHVWESGAHIRIAFLLRENEPGIAKTYLEEARRIVNSDDRLIIRRRQIQEVAASFQD